MRKRIPRWFVLGVVILVLDIGFTAAAIRISDERNPVWLKKTPAAGLVFFRGFNKNYSDIGRDSTRRLNQILALYRQGRIGEIGCIGGARVGHDVYGSVFMKARLVKAGIPAEVVWADKFSYDSRSNWQVARKLIREKGWRQVVVVASPLHSRRLKKIITRDPVPGVEFIFAPYSYRQSDPPLSVLDAWKEVHQEALAMLANTLIPDQIYPAVIKKWREIVP